MLTKLSGLIDFIPGLKSSGRLLVDGSQVTQPISGTVAISGASSNRSEVSNAAISGTAFAYINTALKASTAATRLLYINNSAGNTKSMVLTQLFIAVGAGTSNWIDVSLFSGPTVTANGTTATPVNRYIGNATTSVLSIYTGPTVSAAGTIVDYRPNGINNTGAVLSFYEMNPYLILPPGQKLLISAIAKANNTPIDVNIQWFEAVV